MQSCRRIIVLMFVLLTISNFTACGSKQGATEQSQTSQVEQKGLKAGQKAGERMVKTVNGVEFAFRWCPAGTFMMGSPESEEGRDEEREEQHQITLNQGFWMLETEVTQKQWEAIMGDNPSEFTGEELPVENVTRDDCDNFCKKCTEIGFPVQLPSEAQWEYACRAGTTGAYAGNLDEMAWYNEKYDSGHTHPVGTKKPNAWGLYDMYGNVAELCQEIYEDSDYGPRVPSRGGSWLSNAQRCRSAYCLHDSITAHGDVGGFRVVIAQ